MGFHALLQEIFLIQGSNLHLLRLLHCRQILYRWATGKPRYPGCWSQGWSVLFPMPSPPQPETRPAAWGLQLLAATIPCPTTILRWCTGSARSQWQRQPPLPLPTWMCPHSNQPVLALKAHPPLRNRSQCLLSFTVPSPHSSFQGQPPLVSIICLYGEFNLGNFLVVRLPFKGTETVWNSLSFKRILEWLREQSAAGLGDGTRVWRQQALRSCLHFCLGLPPRSAFHLSYLGL